MAKYRTSPVTVEAIEWDGTNVQEVLDFVATSMARVQITIDLSGRLLWDDGAHLFPLTVGDWLVRHDDGMVHLCSNRSFRRLYEPDN